MYWPESQDYNEVIQNPAICFSDPELMRGEVAVNQLGLPVPYSGSFADVYKSKSPDGKYWAVKCFTRHVPGLADRYRLIDEHLKRSRLPFMVKFRFLEEGIRVRGQWFPVVKMEWIEGIALNEFVKANADKPAILDALLQIWVKMARGLREAKIAHGDLQHGNVLLVPANTSGKLSVRLIDYDGMWVPAMGDLRSHETGHPAYQHPLRVKLATGSPDSDRFPHLVVACALRSLIVGGSSLWNEFDNGDNLLFRATDLMLPGNSMLVKRIVEMRDLTSSILIGHIGLRGAEPLSQTPWIDDLIPNGSHVDSTMQMPVSQAKPILSALPVPVPHQNDARLTTAREPAPSDTILPSKPEHEASANARQESTSKKTITHRHDLRRRLLIAAVSLLSIVLVGLPILLLARPKATPSSSPSSDVDRAGIANFEKKSRVVLPPKGNESKAALNKGKDPLNRAGVPVVVDSKSKLTEPKPGEERVFDVGNDVKMTFCWVPGTNGNANLGSPMSERNRGNNEDEHQVELDGFWMAKTEMTQLQYVKLTGKRNPSYFCAIGGGKDNVAGLNTDDFPVERVSWNDAQECIKQMKVPEGIRRIALPSEAQWEWACRGGRGNVQAFFFGDALNGDVANTNGKKPYGTTTEGNFLARTARVGSYESKAQHPWGLCDMHGNVWEWCDDFYAPYGNLPLGKNPVQPAKQSNDSRVWRGGSWKLDSMACRSATRYVFPPGVRYDDVGFRVCLVVDESLSLPPNVGNGGSGGNRIIDPKVDVKEPRPGEERVFEVGNDVRMTFCWIPGTNGRVTLGSPNQEAKRDANEAEHQVKLDGFWMAKTEMTQLQYVKLTGKKNPSWFCADGGGKNAVLDKNTDDFPVEQVSWNDAQDCIKQMKAPHGMERIALPSESQWEWACRGGQGNVRAFHFGDSLNGEQANSNGTFPYGTTIGGTFLATTEKVGSFELKAAHPWGLCDMHGNVREWCEDYYGPYETLPRGKNPVQMKPRDAVELDRVSRGGSWRELSESCRSAERSWSSPDKRQNRVGFRVCVIVN